MDSIPTWLALTIGISATLGYLWLVIRDSE